MVCQRGLENHWNGETFGNRALTLPQNIPTMKETSVKQLRTKTEAEEVTVGNHKSIIKEWEVKTLLVELYGIVECNLRNNIVEWGSGLTHRPAKSAIAEMRFVGSNPTSTTKKTVLVQLVEQQTHIL